jgi:hypothetical protein
MALTVVALNALKPREKPYKLADERGLYIQVMPNGSKLWRYKYRLHQREKRLSMEATPMYRSQRRAKGGPKPGRSSMPAAIQPSSAARQSLSPRSAPRQPSMLSLANSSSRRWLAMDAPRTPSRKVYGFLSS